MHEVRKELARVCELLTAQGISAKLLGENMGIFVHAVDGERAIELSRSQEGVGVEFWRDKEGLTDHEQTYNSMAEAVVACASWLKWISPQP